MERELLSKEALFLCKESYVVALKGKTTKKGHPLGRPFSFNTKTLLYMD